ncbi:hypothetical protein PUNSTDRAFT_52147, partial [Punctularia strigosozonata HHB-11173 SS5]|uniref:uncharacterized protein n=1 Tax=Punctularia strigosozonata (strain HHB-11173) TaxID=741275 RepID=UPI000441646D
MVTRIQRHYGSSFTSSYPSTKVVSEAFCLPRRWIRFLLRQRQQQTIWTQVNSLSQVPTPLSSVID